MSRAENTRERLGAMLWDARGEIVPGPELCGRLGISRQAVWKILNQLQREGFPVMIVSRRGYRLPVETKDCLHPLWLALAAQREGWHPVFSFHEEVSSTQQVAREFARSGAPSGTVVLAKRQTAGRGRRGRTWMSPPLGGIYMSVLMRPMLAPSQAPLLSLVAGLAVRDALQRTTGIESDLKWPNDLLVNGRKICGILTEASSDPDRILYAVTGMGINIDMTEEDVPDSLRSAVTSVRMLTGASTHQGWLVVAVLDAFATLVQALEQGKGSEIMKRYSKACATLGQDVRMVTDQEEISGWASGISAEGALLVETAKGLRAFSSADVVHASRVGE